MICSIGTSVLAPGQSGADSLERLLERELSDSVRGTVYNSLARFYQYRDPARCKSFALQALDIAEKEKIRTVEVGAHAILGFYYYMVGNFGEALAQDTRGLQASELMGDSLQIAKAYNNIGNDYYDLGDYDEAYSHFTRSFRLAKLIRDSLLMNTAIHNVGRVFKEIGQYDKAMNHLLHSMRMSKKMNDEEGLPYSLDEIGDVLQREGKYDSAVTTLLTSLDYSRKLNVLILEPRTLSKIANVYAKMKNFKMALAYYDTTESLHLRTNNQFGLAEVELGRGLVYFMQNRFEASQTAIEHSLSIAKTLNALVLQSQCYQELSSFWETKGDYQKALNAYKQYNQLEDSLFSQETQAKLQRDQVQFETEVKDDQIAALTQLEENQKNELKKQEFIRNILVVTFALTAILLLSVYRSGQRRKHINALLIQHQEETEKRREELERLNEVKDKFFSIISHDLRSPINALAGVLDLLDREAVSKEEFDNNIRELRKRFNHTRTLLNNLLDWTLLQMDKLSVQTTEINIHETVAENIQLLRSVITKPLDLISSVPEDTVAMGDKNTVNLVIRNLMSNAMKFTNEGGTVETGSLVKDDEVHVYVKDNGIGMKPDVLAMLFDKTSPYSTRGTANEKGTGLGLILSKEFVEKNGGRIWVESEEGKGSTFWFSLKRK